jgi:PAS domain S-box-containing protein
MKNDLNSFADEKNLSDHILDNSRSMISIIDQNYSYVKVNATFCRVQRLAKQNIIGKTVGNLWGIDIFQKNIKEKIDLCFTGETVRYEASFKTPETEIRYFEIIFRPVIYEKGKITNILADTLDINELKLLKGAVLEKEEELRKLETNLPIGFLRCDPDGKILQANQAFLKIMECYDDKSITNQNIKDFYHDKRFFDVQYDQLIKYHTKNFGRVSLKNCKGVEIPCRVSGFLAIDDCNNPSFIEFAVEDSSRELMLENRLLQAQKLETIGALAGGIAHDFNNILSTISGYSEMLLEDMPKNSPMSEKVARIQGAVLKAQSITNQILTFSRQLEQEKIPVRISEVLNETIGFVKSSIPSNITVKSFIHKKDAITFADPTQLFRVFLNLMTNALQAMELKGGTISVAMTVVEGVLVKHDLKKDIVADEYALISFEDTGVGMEPSLLTRIFEPFFTTREVGKGTGLGLSVIHGIVSEMEGEILVSSRKDKGTIFYVYLPLTKTNPVLSDNNEKRKKILFITGNKYESRILSLALENARYELIYVSDHNHLLKVMTNIDERPDLVVYMSDSKKVLPEEFISIFNKLETATPCILITESGHEFLEEKLLNSGLIMQYLIKPVSLREISNAIQASLK